MITPEGVYHPDFDLSDFRYAAARYVRLLIRARWKSEPGFLPGEALNVWGLHDIADDTMSASSLLDQAATALGVLNTQFLARCGSGGVRETDESTPAGRLIQTVAGFAQTEGGGPSHNGALVEAARLLRDGKKVDWASLIDWNLLGAIRSDLDELPHPRPGKIARRTDAQADKAGKAKLTSPELSRREAAAYLGVSVETLLQFQRAGLLRYRNASPPGSGKPRYRYPVADLDRLMQQGYQRDQAKPQRVTNRPPKEAQPQSYEHLDLD